MTENALISPKKTFAQFLLRGNSPTFPVKPFPVELSPLFPFEFYLKALLSETLAHTCGKKTKRRPTGSGVIADREQAKEIISELIYE
ncbi:MAG: hypothetical protein LBJ64_07580 [Deltaproteobacteria bacterium]|jgi:hypothetical protein|nr:hypothetical protein [Deltaproteobacteria bacterium]